MLEKPPPDDERLPSVLYFLIGIIGVGVDGHVIFLIIGSSIMPSESNRRSY